MSLKPLKRIPPSPFEQLMKRQQQQLWPRKVFLDLDDQIHETILLEVIVLTSRDQTQFVDDIKTSLSLVCRKWKTIVRSADFDGQLKKLLAERNPDYRYRIKTRTCFHSHDTDTQDIPTGRLCVHKHQLFVISSDSTAVNIYQLLENRTNQILRAIRDFAPMQPHFIKVQQLQVCRTSDGTLQIYTLVSAREADATTDSTFVCRSSIDRLGNYHVDMMTSTYWLVNDVTANTCGMTVDAGSGDVIVAARTERRVFVFDRDGVPQTQIDLTALFDAPPNNRTQDSIVSMCVVRLAAEEDAYIVMTITARDECKMPTTSHMFRTPRYVIGGFLPSLMLLMNSVSSLRSTATYGLRLSKIRCTSSTSGDPLEIVSQRKFEQCIPLRSSSPTCPIYLLDSTIGLLTRRVLRLGPDLETRPGVGIIEGIPANVQVGDPHWPRFDPETMSFFFCRQRPNAVIRLCQQLRLLDR